MNTKEGMLLGVCFYDTEFYGNLFLGTISWPPDIINLMLKKIFGALFLISTIFLLLVIRASAQHCPETDYDCQIAEIQKAIDSISEAHETNKKELASLRKKVANIRLQIRTTSAKLDALEKDIEKREEDQLLREELLKEKAWHYYVTLRQFDPFLSLFMSNSISSFMLQLSIRRKIIDKDKEAILQIAREISQLKKDKATLEKSRKSLESARQSLEKKAEFLAEEVAKVEVYIAKLTAKQQELLAKKFASLNLPISLGGGPLYCVDDRKIDPGFSPGFAFFTFGIPHRVGMNQYGAYGRAKAGQNHEQILRAYFDNVQFETRPNINITVEGYGTMPLETYLLGIYEMPENWPMEALKAQAIAARSYALAYTNNGSRPICTTQQCQVYKRPHKTGNWKGAVEETRGKVMVSGGQVITAWYASTAGGYTFTNSDVWGGSYKNWTKRLRDTSGEISSFSDLLTKAYDKDSPCFYAAQGWREEYKKSAWLKPEEVADIANVWRLAQKDPGTQAHLAQTDKPNPDGVETWGLDRVKQELRNRGVTPLNTVSDVYVSGWDTNLGRTTSVTVVGDTGTWVINGDEFREFFNLRAPSNIQIVGPLYNVEKR